MSKKALITGVTGQDGSYLAEFLLDKRYEVHGLKKTLGKSNESIIPHYGNVLDKELVHRFVSEIKPDEIYHLASKVESRFGGTDDFEFLDDGIKSTYNLLSAIKTLSPHSRFFYASSSKVFGRPNISPQNENTPFSPVSFYGISKAGASYLVKTFREADGIFACSGILFNHESSRRNPIFLPRKITRAAVRIKLGLEKELKLGDINAKRDWGFAGDYIEAMWLMLQAEKPEDYVIGTGVIHSVSDILDVAFREAGLDWKKYVAVDKNLAAQPELYPIVADISKIKKKLGWQPQIEFEKLIKMMVREDLKLAE